MISVRPLLNPYERGWADAKAAVLDTLRREHLLRANAPMPEGVMAGIILAGEIAGLDVAMRAVARVDAQAGMK